LEVNAAQLTPGNEQDFSAVILQMEKQAHLAFADKAPIRVAASQ